MSLKSRLAERERPTAVYPLQIADPTDATKALEAAQKSHRRSVLQNDPQTPEYKKTKRAVAAAEKKLRECFEEIRFRALPPAIYEALISAHPPTKEQLDAAKPGEEPVWDVETFRPALISACVEGDMSESDWAEALTQRLSKGEVQALFVTALTVNEQVRGPGDVIPKGYGGMLNSLSS